MNVELCEGIAWNSHVCSFRRVCFSIEVNGCLRVECIAQDWQDADSATDCHTFSIFIYYVVISCFWNQSKCNETW